MRNVKHDTMALFARTGLSERGSACAAVGRDGSGLYGGDVAADLLVSEARGTEAQSKQDPAELERLFARSGLSAGAARIAANGRDAA